jgi:hypothetical protein
MSPDFCISELSFSPDSAGKQSGHINFSATQCFIYTPLKTKLKGVEKV